MAPRPRRWKVQCRVDLMARDRSDTPFLLGTIWRTLSQVDHQATAENLLGKRQAERPDREFRIAEEWPIGTELRPLMTVTGRKQRERERERELAQENT